MNKSVQEKPSEKFRKAMRQILSVPKKELERREVAYKKERKASKRPPSEAT